MDARGSDGIEVRLLWQLAGNRVLVHLIDNGSAGAFVVEVAAEGAPDAFRHPRAHLCASAPDRVQVLVESKR